MVLETLPAHLSGAVRDSHILDYPYKLCTKLSFDLNVGVYQAVGRGLDRRLEELGGSRICERGEGDDKETMESDWETWTKEKFVPLLMDPMSEAKSAPSALASAVKAFTYLPYLLPCVVSLLACLIALECSISTSI